VKSFYQAVILKLLHEKYSVQVKIKSFLGELVIGVLCNWLLIRVLFFLGNKNGRQ